VIKRKLQNMIGFGSRITHELLISGPPPCLGVCRIVSVSDEKGRTLNLFQFTAIEMTFLLQ